MLKSLASISVQSPHFSPKSSPFSGKISHPQLALLYEGIVVFIGLLVGLAFVQYASPGLAGNDGYYHIKMGYLIRAEGLTPLFDYLPFTILNEAAYYDHHLLFHAWLALFATVDPVTDGGIALTQAAKLSALIMASLAFMSTWWLLKRENVPFTAVWTFALLAISEAFLYRMSMPRAQSLSLLLLVWGIYWLLKEKYLHLMLLGFIFTWAYNAFPLLLVIGVIYCIATLIREQRLVWQAVVYPAIGIGLGILINPYFPQNVDFIIHHLAPKLGESATKVGNEWAPYRTLTLIENSAGTFMLLLGGIFAIGWQDKRIDKRTLFVLGLVVAFGTMLFESRRFIEYFPPMVLLFAAFSSAPILNALFKKDNFKYRWMRWGGTAVVLLLLFIPTVQTIKGASTLVANSKPANQYAKASLWLNQNAPEESHLFQTDWDDFTRLFFYNSQLQYTAGLDPTFMELHDEALFNEWVAITQGKVASPSQKISSLFGSTYIFSDLKHTEFIQQANADSQLQEVYQDEFSIIYQIQK